MSYIEGADLPNPTNPDRKPRKRRSADSSTKLGDGKSAKPWLDRIDDRLDAEKKWREKGRKVVNRFKDDRSKRNNDLVSRINILWANTEVLKSALYAKTAVPDVRRRFPDAKGGDPVARTAAEVIERALNYVNDAYDIDPPIEDALADYLLPGRGSTWVDYEPTIIGEGDEATVGAQKLCTVYVYWKDFVHGKARTWQTVPWAARRMALSLGEFKKKFPHIKEEPDLSTTLLDNDERRPVTSGASSGDDDGLVEVWQIWDKGTMERIYVARGFTTEIERKADPLHLEGFFPFPPPLFSVRTTDTLTPEPEFALYQDQADELDRVQSRIRVLTEALRWKGIYDGSIDGDNVLAGMAKAGDNVFLAYPNWNMLREKGGIEAAIGFWPLDKIVLVLEQLYPRAQQLIQEIYEITGISDIVRGATDPNETLGAQKLKSQFGSMRMQRRQRDVQRFIRDDYRIKAEVIAEHFTEETLKAITNIQLPTKEEQLMAQQQLQQMEMAKQEAAAGQQPPGPPGMGHNGGPPLEGAGGPPALAGGPPAMAGPPPGMNGATPPPGLNGGGVPPPQPSGPPPMAGAAAPTAMPGMPPPPMAEESLPEEAEGPQEAVEPDETGEDEKEQELRSIIESPTWDDVMELLRSEKLRGTRVDIETDSTILIDAETEKQQRIEFMSAARDMMVGAMEMITSAPSTIPLVREMFLFGIRSFKPGRALEQAFEDAFDELAKSPPKPPQEADDTTWRQAEVDAKLKEIDAKYGIEGQKAVADAKFKQDSLDLDAAGKKDVHDLEMAKLELEKQKIQLERDKVALEQRRLDVETEFKGRQLDQSGEIEHRKIDQTGELEDRKLNQVGELETRKLDQGKEIETRKLDDASAMGRRDIVLRAAAQNKQLIDEKAAAAAVGGGTVAGEEPPTDLLGVETLQKSIEVMAQALAQSQEIQTKALAEGFAQQGEAMAEMAEAMSKPKRVIRGEDNRVVGVETVQ